jgi:hypothetical protein
MIAKFSGAVAIAFVLIAPAGPLAADPADQCSARCEGNATSERRACSELPPNPSCRIVVEKNRLRCFEYCDRTYPRAPGRLGVPGSGLKVDGSTLLHRASDRP